MNRERAVEAAGRVLRDEGPAALLKKAPPHIVDRVEVATRRVYWPIKYRSDRELIRRVLDDKRDELPVIKDVLSEVGDGDVFFDVGANQGLYSGLVASTVTGGKVVAFEPSEEYVERFEETVAAIDVKSDVQIRNVALSDTDGTIEYFQGSHAIGVDQAESGDDPSIVQQRRGDDLVRENEIPHPDVVKIDVDGAELRVLKGLKETLSSGDTVLYVEVHTPITKFVHDIEKHEGSVAELADLLEELGYDARIIHSRWNNYFIKARKA